MPWPEGRLALGRSGSSSVLDPVQLRGARARDSWRWAEMAWKTSSQLWPTPRSIDVHGQTKSSAGGEVVWRNKTERAGLSLSLKQADHGRSGGPIEAEAVRTDAA